MHAGYRVHVMLERWPDSLKRWAYYHSPFRGTRIWD